MHTHNQLQFNKDKLTMWKEEEKSTQVDVAVAR